MTSIYVITEDSGTDFGMYYTLRGACLSLDEAKEKALEMAKKRLAETKHSAIIKETTGEGVYSIEVNNNDCKDEESNYREIFTVEAVDIIS